MCVLALVACRPATELEIVLTTDAPCESLRGTTVTVGALGEIETRAPTTASGSCAAGGDLGTLVVVPSGGKNDEVSFKVIAGVGRDPQSCVPPYGPGCIVARRAIRYVPHTKLRIAVPLRDACNGVACAEDETCVAGACAPATIGDPNACAGASGCDESSLGPGVPVDAGAPDVVTPPPPDAGPPSYDNPLAAGAAHTCAITPSGGVKCWGDNSHGELGDGTNTERHAPVDVKGLSGKVTSIAAGLNFTCAVLQSGGVTCWGKNDFGELGNGQNADSSAPVLVQGVSNVVSIATGCKHVCTVTRAGRVQCWGWNSKGQLGYGKADNANLAVDPQGLASGGRFVAAGFEFTCVALETGVSCFGEDDNNQLGDGRATNSLVPVSATIAFRPSLLATGANHVFAYNWQGGLQTVSWGLASGTGGLNAPIDAVSAGDGYTCVVHGGAVSCWGTNDNGRLGDGTTTPRVTGVTPQGLGAGVIALRAGYDHACVMTQDGHIKCWGTNTNGQIGDNTVTERHAPVDVPWP
jgi:hypothetical protein